MMWEPIAHININHIQTWGSTVEYFIMISSNIKLSEVSYTFINVLNSKIA